MHRTAEQGIAKAVKGYLAAGTDLNVKDGLLMTPLHYADTKEIAELLIVKGANINAKTNVGTRRTHLQSEGDTHP